jgi:nucleoside-diphosphate-sugar epimerase
MRNDRTIVCVTGGTGIIGRRIVSRLLDEGHHIRVLSRKKSVSESRVEHFCGGLQDERILKEFIDGADMVFHCAAELYNEALMWDVNVNGTERLLHLAQSENIKYLCYLSSAGVVGSTKEKWVNESTPCNPQNSYERSKLAAEQLVAQGIEGCSVVILRPTNVMDDNRPGALALPMKRSFTDYLKVLVKGDECAHLVHADDVASAAVYFISRHFDRPQCFFVSCDHEPSNTFAGLWSLYKSCKNKQQTVHIRRTAHLPIIFPYILRKIRRGTGNLGDVRYSSQKLMSEGFSYSVGVQGAVNRLVLCDGKA